jgi:hypothetical protein
MAVRETLTVRQQPSHRQRVRTFALAWSGLTLLIGALTFVAIYATTGIVASSRGIAPASITENKVADNTSNASVVELPAAQQNQNPSDDSQALSAAAQVTATLLQANNPPSTNTKPASQESTATLAPTLAGQQSQGQQGNTNPSGTIPAVKDADFDLGIAVQENAEASTFKVWTAMVGEQLKLNWVKMQIDWSNTEKTKGQIDFGALDVEMPMLHQANIRVMLSIAKAPVWARDPGAKTKPDPNGDLHDGPPANPQDYANFVTAILKRYPGMVHAIEVWNEINLDREWTTNPQKLDPARYVTLLKTAGDAIKAADPNILIISAALSPTGANIPPRAVDDFIFMDQLIKAGMLQYADCVGAHHNGINVPPNADYNNIPERKPRAKYHGPWDNPDHSWAFKTTLQTYANQVKKAGSNLKLCVTEFGWPSAEGLNGKVRPGFEFAADNTAADQANFTDQAITLMQQWGFVRLAFLWNLNYAAQAGWNLQGPVGDNVAWSILGKNFQPRPVWQKIVDRNFRGQARKASQ